MTPKQTAIEWLIEAIKIHDKSFDEFYKAEIEQAKQMEREQMIDAHIEGQRVFDKHPHTQLYYIKEIEKENPVKLEEYKMEYVHLKYKTD